MEITEESRRELAGRREELCHQQVALLLTSCHGGAPGATLLSPGS